MKKLLLLIALTSLAVSVNAKGVSQQMAASKAEQLMKVRIDGFNGTVSSVKAVAHNGQTAYYVVQFAPQGWALISADDTSMPLFGYSPEGVYQMDGQPDNVKAQMSIFGEQIIDNARHLSKQNAGWQTVDGMPQVTEAQHRANRAAEKIEPLIKVNWNQSGSYRKFCPTGTYVGCVAVGMAQAMSVAQHPARPTGDHGYQHNEYGWLHINYDEEEPYDWATILSSPSSDNVARLLYQCGVAVNMNYGTDGSGAQSSAIAPALKTYFCYPQSVKYYKRDSYSGNWEELVLQELREGRAVIYCGTDPKGGYGHCFNLDGYDGSFFHVNWGWGGSNNAYFPLDGLKDVTMGYTYTDGQDIVVGIRPPSEYPSDIILSNLSVAQDAPVGTVVADVTVESEATNPTYTFTLRGARNPITKKYASVPFKIEDMKLVTTEEMPNSTSRLVEIIVKNNENGHELSRTFTINIVNSSGINDVNTVDNGKTDFYSLDGQRQNAPRKGLTIVRNGKQVKKTIIK